MRIMDDVNLDRVIVETNGKACRLEFIDMREGVRAGVIECRDVILMNYHNIMDAEGFATYVGQVDLDELVGDAGRGKLCELGFRFRDAAGRTSTTGSETIQHLHVEGGEVCIDVCCGECQVTNSG